VRTGQAKKREITERRKSGKREAEAYYYHVGGRGGSQAQQHPSLDTRDKNKVRDGAESSQDPCASRDIHAVAKLARGLSPRRYNGA